MPRSSSVHIQVQCAGPQGLRQSGSIEKVQQLLMQAGNSPDIQVKKRYFNEAYTVLANQARLRSAYLTKPLETLFFQLIYDYAVQTCYAQESIEKDAQGNSVDEEEGFRHCARLLEFSISQQLKACTLHDTKFSWNLSATFDELIMQLEAHPIEQSYVLQIDPTVLVQKATEYCLRESMAQAVTKLCYCYQNMQQYSSASPENLSRQQKLQECCAALIGTESQKQKQQLVDFLYNRVRFMADLEAVVQGKTVSCDEKMRCYDPVRQLLADCYEESDPKRRSLLAQIANMQGLIIARSEGANALKSAEPYFREAFAEREQLIAAFERDEEQWAQKRLLCNIRTSLITCLLDTTKWRSASAIAEARQHGQALHQFLQEAHQRNDLHSYHADYIPLIQKAMSGSLSITERIREWVIHSIFGQCIRSKIE